MVATPQVSSGSARAEPMVRRTECSISRRMLLALDRMTHRWKPLIRSVPGGGACRRGRAGAGRTGRGAGAATSR